MLANVGGEYSKFWDFYWGQAEARLPAVSILLLVLGSFVGTGIGYSGWWCRNIVSATSFTLIGGESLFAVVTSTTILNHLRFCMFYIMRLVMTDICFNFEMNHTKPRFLKFQL